MKQAIASQFPELASKTALPLAHVVKTNFHQKFTAKHQKGRRASINLHSRVTARVECLQNKGHIEKFSSCSEESIVSLIAITEKNNQYIKLALDSKVLNKSILKKYQVSNIEWPTDSISQKPNKHTKPSTSIFFNHRPQKCIYTITVI